MGYDPYYPRLCLGGGEQWWKVRRRVYSPGMCVGFMPTIAPILVFVQVHTTGPSSQAISRCSSVSVAPHLTQDVVVVRWIATKRSLVGIISCMAAYHIDFIGSESPVVCTFAHTRCHAIPGYFRAIRSWLVSLNLVAIVSSTPQGRFLNLFMVYCWPGGGTYAMSKA